jgi:ABC-type glycerol-3-phosphate transport system substrate-binding protein
MAQLQTRRGFLEVCATSVAGAVGMLTLAACGGATATTQATGSTVAQLTASQATATLSSAATSEASTVAKATVGSATSAVSATAPAASSQAPKTGGQAVSISVLHQDWQPLTNMLKQAVTTFKTQQPQVTVTLVPVAYGDLATKVKTEMAAGTGPEVLHSYSDFWRAVDASAVFMPLTPELFSRDELAKITYPTLLDSVPSKRKEVYLLPYADGLNGDALLYNPAMLTKAGVDPKGFKTIDDVISAGAKLTVSQSGAITTEGIWFSDTQDPVRNWILDQGATFYDEQAHQWTWQTSAAEQAMQKVVDVYHQGTSWVTTPTGVKQPLGEGRAAMEMGAGFYELSGDATSYPHLELADMPMPSFVPGKTPHYFQTAISGWALSALLKSGDEKTKAGADFLRFLYTPEEAMALATQYSGAIFIQGVYNSPAFKSSTFGSLRTNLPDQVIANTLTLDMAVEPGFSTQMGKVIAGTMTIQAALADMQQQYSSKETEARKQIGAG